MCDGFNNSCCVNDREMQKENMARAGGVGVSAWCVRSGVGSLRRSVRLAVVTPFIHVLLGRPPVFGHCAHSLGATQEGSWGGGGVGC